MTSNQSTPNTRPTRRLVGATVAALIAIGGVVGFTALRGSAADDSPPPTATTAVLTATVSTAPRPARTAHLIIQDEIDRALAERGPTVPTISAATTTTTTAHQQGFAPVTPNTAAARPAYLIIQDEIDRALAEREHAEDSG